MNSENNTQTNTQSPSETNAPAHAPARTQTDRPQARPSHPRGPRTFDRDRSPSPAGQRSPSPRGSFRGRPAPTMRPRKAIDVIPPAGDNIRIIPLGGVEEIGKNMTIIEYKGDIIVIDVGFQFQEDDTPGIDYILPNTKYLEDRKDKIRGVFITHGHLDHIGGIPYIMDRIGNPPIYTRALTSVLIKKRQDEFPHLPPLDIRIVEKEDKITVGNLKVRFFAVDHC
jgi:Metallo-beta-lactamase superfamily